MGSSGAPSPASFWGPTLQQVAFFGNFDPSNFGNESTLRAMLENFHRLQPNARAICITTNPTAITATYGIRAIGIRENASPCLGSARSPRAKFAKDFQWRSERAVSMDSGLVDAQRGGHAGHPWNRIADRRLRPPWLGTVRSIQMVGRREDLRLQAYLPQRRRRPAKYPRRPMPGQNHTVLGRLSFVSRPFDEALSQEYRCRRRRGSGLSRTRRSASPNQTPSSRNCGRSLGRS